MLLLLQIPYKLQRKHKYLKIKLEGNKVTTHTARAPISYHILFPTVIYIFQACFRVQPPVGLRPSRDASSPTNASCRCLSYQDLRYTYVIQFEDLFLLLKMLLLFPPDNHVPSPLPSYSTPNVLQYFSPPKRRRRAMMK